MLELFIDAHKLVLVMNIKMTVSKLRGAADTADVDVSVDGTWQRKDCISLNGVVTAISIDSGKVLDTEILSKSCRSCTRMQTTKAIDPQVYDKWSAAHKCSLNYKGSSAPMEKVGTEKIFSQ